MKKIKLGLQIHAVREDFAEDPAKTLQCVAQMGYSGVEMTTDQLNLEKYTVEFYADALQAAHLECFSMMISHNTIAGNKVEEAIEITKKLRCDTLVIGMMNLEPLAKDDAYRYKLLEDVNTTAEKIRASGLRTGFHNHDFDHLNTVDGKTPFLDFLFDNIREDFMLMIDTGNTQGGGADPITYIQKYPGRTQICHFKGYSPELKYLTPVWESSIDGDVLIDTLVTYGDAQILSVEFGARGDYIPMERAEKSYIWLSEKLKKKELL